MRKPVLHLVLAFKCRTERKDTDLGDPLARRYQEHTSGRSAKVCHFDEGLDRGFNRTPLEGIMQVACIGRYKECAANGLAGACAEGQKGVSGLALGLLL